MTQNSPYTREPTPYIGLALDVDRLLQKIEKIKLTYKV